MRWGWVAVVVAAALVAASPARANWVRAESPHFVVYANDSEKDAVRFAERLERFHAAMALLTGRTEVTPIPSNRVTIYAVGSENKIKELVGDKRSAVVGFYLPRAGGSRAFVPDIRVAPGENDFSLTVLLHEYAHHFLLSSSSTQMPRWFDEGAAEFFASANFEPDGTVGIGRPAYHRAAELVYATDVTVAQLLDSKLYKEKHGNKYNAFYGRSWALFHYLFFEPSRKGQLINYANAIATGKSEQEAATLAFGDLKELEKNLDSYLRRSRTSSFRFTPDMISSAPVKVATLSDGESAVLPLVIRSQRGVNREEATALVAQVRAVAAKFPADPAVLTALAEAEHDAGNDAAAIAAADKAIALDGNRINAYVQKGYALFRLAQEATPDQKPAAFKAAMKPFEALNKVDNDHPLPLIHYYRSFTEQGREPPELARHALERASQVAPFDQQLTYETAMMHAREGKITLARLNLGALAANPHGGALARRARRLADSMAGLADGTRWEGNPLQEVDVDLAEVDGPENGEE